MTTCARPPRGLDWRRPLAVLLVLMLALWGLLTAPIAPAHAGVGDWSPGIDAEQDPPDGTGPLPYEYQSANDLLKIQRDDPRLTQDALRRVNVSKANRQSTPAESFEHMQIRWKMYLGAPPPKSGRKLSFPEWRDAYVRAFNNRKKGESFETALQRELNLTEDNGGWVHNKQLPLKEGSSIRRRADFYNNPTDGSQRWFLELKSGNTIDRDQLRDYARYAKETGRKGIYLFACKPPREVVQAIKDAVAEVGGPPDLIRAAYFLTDAKADPPGPGVLTVGGQSSVSGGLDNAIDNSPDSPETAAEGSAVADAVNADIDEAEQQGAPSDGLPAAAPRQQAPADPGQVSPSAPGQASPAQRDPAQQPAQDPAQQPAQDPAAPQPVPVAPAPAAPDPAPAQLPAPAAPLPAPAVPAPEIPLPAPPAIPLPAAPAIPAPAIPAPAIPAPAIPAPAAPAPLPAPVEPAPAPLPAPPVEPAPAPAEPAPAAPMPAPTAGPGGIDFTTLQLSYVADTNDNGPGLRYAFSANPAADQGPSYGGRRSAYLASDAFFVWMALQPSAFWVNLMPYEPDRIIDSQFARTDVGRILLEADFTMKKAYEKYEDPATPLGHQFRTSLEGNKCTSARRQEIVPLPASIHEDGDQMYILAAPLDVTMETRTDDLRAPGLGCSGQDPAATQHNDDLYRTMILPKVVDEVNHAPAFADLRRVYASRVAAEWFRQRSQSHTTAFSDVINSGDISRWTARQPWSPQEVFDRYRTSFYNGDVTYHWSEGDMNWTQVLGGVDFTNIPLQKVDTAKFTAGHRTLPRTASSSLFAPSIDTGSKQVWLGGLTSARPLSDGWHGHPAGLVPFRPIPRGGGTLNPLFYAVITLPLAAWLGAGVLLFYRRRRANPPRVT